MEKKFSDYPISEKIVKALDEMGYVSPMEVQEATIEAGLEGRDLVVLSKTGSGKTAAFGVPAIHLLKTGARKRGLVMAPTRELAVQVEQEIHKIAKYEPVKTIVVYGKHSMNVEVEQIEKGFDLMVGTPGRVLDHIEQGNFDAKLFDLVVLDEADRMLDMGFIDQVRKILKRTSKDKTTFLFSATIPDEIMEISQKQLVNPYMVTLESDVKTVDEVEQYYFHVKKNQKRSRLYDILKFYNPDSCLIFCNTRFEVDRVTDFLVSHGITAKSIHGANSQSLRLKFLSQFKRGKFRVLVATDVAARGLHIEDLELVINYDLPVEKDSYIHRIGRTGRAGKKGLALSLVAEGDLYQLYMLEEHAGTPIEEKELPPSQKVEMSSGDSAYTIAYRELDDYNPEEDSKGGRAPFTGEKRGERSGKKRRGGSRRRKTRTEKAHAEKRGEKSEEDKKRVDKRADKGAEGQRRSEPRRGKGRGQGQGRSKAKKGGADDAQKAVRAAEDKAVRVAADKAVRRADVNKAGVASNIEGAADKAVRAAEDKAVRAGDRPGGLFRRISRIFKKKDE